ncbi:MAG TPA: hypothetical protein DCE25_05245 [Pseudomonas sp.]|nr:hypothetical protein [Pseudomonas sp.]
MSKQVINLGSAPTGQGGDTPRSANIKIGANFDELYEQLGGNTLPAALPVAKGGTGSTTPAGARGNLGLGNAATLNTGSTAGSLATVDIVGLASTLSETKSWLADATPGIDPVLFGPGSPSSPSGGTGYWYKQTIRYGTSSNRLIIAWPYGTGSTGTIKMRSVFNGSLTPEIELYHTGNTTRAADGTLKAI